MPTFAPFPMQRPDYSGHSISNLMASIQQAYGVSDPYYPPCPALAPELLRDSQHVILLVVDGLGSHNLRQLSQLTGQFGLLDQYHTTLSSAFPSTTASANTVFLSGGAAQQHGLTGWHMFFGEIGSILSALPLTPRHGGPCITQQKIDITALLQAQPLCSRLPVASTLFSPESVAHSPFNQAFAGTATRYGYKHLHQALQHAAQQVHQQPQRQFIQIYWPDLDSLAHDHGCTSEHVQHAFRYVTESVYGFLNDLQGSNSLLLLSADHGLIDSRAECRIAVREHPDFCRTLMMPLCGERRLAYCYLCPGAEADFLTYVREHWAEQLWAVPSAELIEQGWFGLGPAHPRLAERVGHYTLIPKAPWTLVDSLPGQAIYPLIGVHGGVSAEEMNVPLLLMRP